MSEIGGFIMENVVVLGAGSWGTALAIVLAENGHNTLIWSHREEQANEINTMHTNKKYLPNTVLPESLRATSDLQVAAQHGSTIVMAVPTKGIREVCVNISRYLEQSALFVHVSKGIEPDTLMRISELMEQSLAAHAVSDIVVLSGTISCRRGCIAASNDGNRGMH